MAYYENKAQEHNKDTIEQVIETTKITGKNTTSVRFDNEDGAQGSRGLKHASKDEVKRKIQENSLAVVKEKAKAKLRRKPKKKSTTGEYG